ncbi:AAA family ATPase [Stutzerimonas nitrititolerans]|uniref:MoxR family ATPase n=1 Tax=Stutzerimonas nitrititolerans TaxID=2482751 RepID=A0AA42BD91_9GAMM|nr:MoxR family ATPase [Stutzerimonas nitrititolerans]AFN77717.1 ATPase [Stutzerimonas stutzeri DSM 10701]KRW64492.1 AAA family ATPase [Pseudomonas sp. TTU2014-096BSC]KRW64938.1 AAA family ATPase [Pseudomonas sp. TTU2014-066ASC]MBA1183994.1 MoxR family ATPase [Stutzerimonas stutzeri]OCX20104.1 AAA family ATPase [Stutzerimonas xanthomarina]RRV21134.1 MoxR family ATPase [Pseudomonas sp. s199]WAD26943.1 MoxR family ATPase [Pseudomonadaceae bacterium T75]HAQ27890.1 MoxR family ATPase [Pseudomona
MEHREAIIALRQMLSTQILGQDRLIERLLIALLADGHMLVEGAPGLAKTRAIKELAGGVEAEFHRIQFTPDLLPADITGTEIYRPETGSFVFQQGPIFHNLVLADEINRAPAKVQSALLEAMAERQVSIGRSTYELSPLFLVMATQNPIEQEGTYPLPEAQLDRFLLHVKLGFPDASVERRILQQARGEAINGESTPEHRVSQQAIFAARKEILGLYMADAVEEYLVQLVMATRTPAKFDSDLAEWIAYGASPRGTISLDRCARAHAWLAGRDFVSPEDIQAMFFDVLRHRLILSFEAEAAGIDQDRVLQRILDVVAVA